jgi:hemerythrin-like domain-containing protein
MAVQIGAKPDAGFDDPIGMLKDCHRRIEHFLGILWMVAEQAEGRGLTSEEAKAVEAALYYFHAGGQRHNADEEESLFPRMRRELAAGSVEEIASLESEHREADEQHAEVERLYKAWIADGRLSESGARRLLAATRRLKNLYAGHIEIEEKVIFPRAAEVLGRSAIATMGEEFRARRR